MGWIELALKDFIDFNTSVVGSYLYLENACWIRFTVALYLDHYNI